MLQQPGGSGRQSPALGARTPSSTQQEPQPSPRDALDGYLQVIGDKRVRLTSVRERYERAKRCREDLGQQLELARLQEHRPSRSTCG